MSAVTSAYRVKQLSTAIEAGSNVNGENASVKLPPMAADLFKLLLKFNVALQL